MSTFQTDCQVLKDWQSILFDLDCCSGSTKQNVSVECIGDRIVKLYIIHFRFRAINVNLDTANVPEAIGSLTQLTALQIGYGMQGPIPKSLTNLKKLASLNLDNNRLSGGLGFIASMESLSNLSLLNNTFSGSVSFTKQLGYCNLVDAGTVCGGVKDCIGLNGSDVVTCRMLGFDFHAYTCNHNFDRGLFYYCHSFIYVCSLLVFES